MAIEETFPYTTDRQKRRPLKKHWEMWQMGDDYYDEMNLRYMMKHGRVSPSFYEGFGLTIAEAMACGTPVITSNTSSLPEVAGDAAILVDPTDVKVIVESVIHLTENYQYRKNFIEKGLLRSKSFKWETVGEEVARVYEKILNL
jgi:glycogen synthase